MYLFGYDWRMKCSYDNGGRLKIKQCLSLSSFYAITMLKLQIISQVVLLICTRKEYWRYTRQKRAEDFTEDLYGPVLM